MIFQAGGTYMRSAFSELQNWGLRDAILPFLLFFAILFAVLQQVKIFKDEKGEGDRKINGIIAFVIAAMIVVPHILGKYTTIDPVEIMYEILPASTIIIIALAVVALMAGLTGATPPAPVMLMIVLASIGIVVYFVLGTIFPNLSISAGPLSDPKLQALLVVLLIFGLVTFFIVYKPKKRGEKEKPYKKLLELFGFKGTND
jgi:predicted neutral ceramidase superfamily lipid hydrolase